MMGPKPRTDLLPPDALMAAAAVLGDGAAEHGARTWEAGRPFSIDYGALLRHLFRWWCGEDVDPKSGHPHLAHAAARVLILLALHLRQLPPDPEWGEIDDRPTRPARRPRTVLIEEPRRRRWWQTIPGGWRR